MAVSLSKVRELTGDDPKMVSLVKNARDAAAVSLQKRGFTAGLTAEVCMVMDFSGSMQGRFSGGEVQAAMERVLALATQFDDDGSVPVILFHNDAWVAGEVDLTNYKGWIDQAIRGKRMGSTSYSAAVREVLDYYGLGHGGSPKRGLFGKRSSAPAAGPRQHPIYVAFFTDGEPDRDDVNPSKEAIKQTCTLPIFWQFIGLGNNFDLLERLDDLTGREVDNTDFFSASRLTDMSDEQLFAKLLDEFPAWVKTVQSKGWITTA